jgi:hypothetical protein
MLPLGTVDSGFCNAGGSSRVNLRFGYLDELLIVSGGVVDTIERVATSPPFNKPRGYFQTSEASKVFDEIDLISEDLALHPTANLCSESNGEH